MKKVLLLPVALLTLSLPLMGRVSASATQHACNVVEIAIWDEFVSSGKALPDAWEEIQLIADMRRKSGEQNPDLLVKINTLAIVPGGPAIGESQRIRRDRWNSNIFAISRTELFDNAKDPSVEGGRFALIVKPDKSEIATHWLPETEAREILGQLEGFDPAKQPLAFENAGELVRIERKARDALVKDFRSQLARDKGSASQTHARGFEKDGSPFHSFYLWLIAALMISSAIVVVVAMRRKAKL